jgi:hypothetical protein
MRSIFIRFADEEHRIRGFATLAKQTWISSLPGHLYQVPMHGLRLLEAEHIKYRRATDAEVKAGVDRSKSC